MTTALSQYDALWQSLRTRRRVIEPRVGIDAAADRWLMRLKQSRAGMRHWAKLARRIEAMEAQTSALSEAELDARLAALREVFRRRRHATHHVVDAFAALRELAWRTLRQKPYLVQIMGGLALFHGQVVQMATGEGKTLTAVLPATLMAWSNPGVHVVTANEYLAGRDAAWMAPIYRRAGLSVAAVLPGHGPRQRAAAYRCAVLYTTQKELVGDWLRDQVRLGQVRDAVSERLTAVPGERRQSGAVLVPGLHAAIVDEADSVLIDQAVMPLVIATARKESVMAEVYRRGCALAKDLVQDQDYTVEAPPRRVRLTELGRRRLATAMTDSDRGPWRAARRRHELVEQALSAVHCYRRGEQYELVDGRAVMIDEFTGRFQPNRQWQHGMHQAVEAKEGLTVSGDGESLASLSFQRFFRQYPVLAGMTGTALGARAEFERTYSLPVRKVPTHQPVRRRKWPMRVYATSQQRWEAVAESVAQLSTAGRPVLVGTRSVAASQHLSRLLEARGLPHQVLNAVEHEKEAQIVAMAGQRGAITVATNMAGRGTDIQLGPGVAELGGLHVILTEMHEANRIDQQLIGRCGRQGDPGSAQVFVSLEDNLVIKFSPVLVKLFRHWYGESIGVIPTGLVRWPFMTAQRRAQSKAFAARKNILRRDEWLDRAVPRS